MILEKVSQGGRMIKYLSLVSAVCVIMSCGGPSAKTDQVTQPKDKGTFMVINVKDLGTITIKLHNDKAPKNVANIVSLANKGFYNGLTFHRIIPGFVIQGGCPVGNGSGTPGYEIADEITPDLKHLKGTVAMANHGPNTNGCQFYICLAPLPQLDGGYTIFGQVIAGMDVVEKIAAVKTGSMDQPLTPVVMENVTIQENE
jgi:cyclophilin family peptidyl-prolyl cis-trans isomerase